jgi:uncharacterized radical SAM superfamily Fe-S cluster-containing enzyme
MLKDYKYIEHTISICPVCLSRVDAKIVEKNNSIYILKHCQEHGSFCDILEESADYYYNRKLFDKPGNAFVCQSIRQKGCPEHEQHTCVGLIEITNKCNLNCPVCFANSGNGDFLSIEEFEKMVDFYIESEGGQSDILQISGGEPTLHPQIIQFIELARKKSLSYVMLNTNGLRIANDIDFVKELARFKGGFEVYLQFDGFDEATHQYFRGKPLAAIKQKALENLDAYSIPTTLVSTLSNGMNDHEIGKIINLGLTTRCVRGINFQPVGYFGRLPEKSPNNRLTITSVIRKIEEQTSSMICKSDFIPLPCNSDRVAITYFYRNKENNFIPLTREIDVRKYLPFIKNTFKFDPDDFIKELSSSIFSKDCCNAMGLFKEFVKLIPMSYMFKTEEEKINYVSDNTFRISITSFVDAYNFDVKSIQKECVHFITPDLKKIPFSTYNFLHRK